MNIFVDLMIVLGVSIGINCVFFLIGFWLKSDLFTDITYALTFFLTTLIVMLINGSYKASQIVILILVALWSLRLGSYLFVRVLYLKVDHRFDKMRNSFWKFGAFWLIQALTIWLVNMPSFMVMILNKFDAFSWYLLIPVILAIAFLTFEGVADWQKFKFIKRQKQTFINEGLWKISRHPNYFGEYMFWIMLMVYALLDDFQIIALLALIGPFYIIFTLYFVSGVPILEKSGYKKFKNDPQYLEYLKTVPCVVPYFGKKGLKKRWQAS